MFLPVFPSRTNLKQHNISVTPKMVEKVIMNLDLSKASVPDCIPVFSTKSLSCFQLFSPKQSKINYMFCNCFVTVDGEVAWL